MRVALAALAAAALAQAADSDLRIEAESMMSDETETVFRQNVSAHSDRMRLQADLLRISDDGDLLQAEGNPASVSITQDADSFEAVGARVEYAETAEELLAEGSPATLRMTADAENFEAVGARIEYAEAGGGLVAEGNPATLRMTADAETYVAVGVRIEYAEADGTLLLPQGGRIESADSSVTAGWLELEEGSRRLDARGSVEFASDEAAGGSDTAAFSENGSIELTGTPATLSAQVKDAVVSSSAGRITLGPDRLTLQLVGQARIVRGSETITGEQITYNLKTGALDTQAKPGERVRAIIKLP